jgi:3-hydroxyisobutyrate dehydrogenase
VLARYAKLALRIGPAGAGQLAKMVNQICIAGLLEALSEGLHFAEHAGLDARRVLEAISQGAAQSWQMDNRAGTMLERRFDFGFAVDWMRKDLRIALEEADRNGSELPVSELVLRFYDELHARGGGRLDTSSLITRLR